MTFKRFLSIKRLFSTWKLIFLFRNLYYWPFSKTTALYLSLLGGPYFAQQHLIRTYLWTLVQNCGLARFSGIDLALGWTLGRVILQFFAHFQRWGDEAGLIQSDEPFSFFRKGGREMFWKLKRKINNNNSDILCSTGVARNFDWEGLIMEKSCDVILVTFFR